MKLSVDSEMLRFTSVVFKNFKAFRQYSVALREFNVLVGPNNAGKSTIIGAFRILSEGIRRARARKADIFHLNGDEICGYRIPLKDVPIATENVFHNYDDTTPAAVQFKFSNGNQLWLQFASIDECYLTCKTTDKQVRTPSDFNREFNVAVGFVPILGPVEHNEQLFQDEAARLALMTHRASRNYRNIWYHFPEGFEEFRLLIQSTWPGMDIQKPEVNHDQKTVLLHMFCPEERLSAA